MKIVPKEEDYFAAFCSMCGPWRLEEFRERLRRATAERLLKENRARQEALLTVVGVPPTRACDRDAWMKASDELTEVFAEHDELLDIAYPRSKPA